MAATGNMGPFTPTRFKASGRVNGIPTFLDKIPATLGGLAGVDAIFGRLVSVMADAPRQFLPGIPTNGIPVGILIADPTIMYADPGMRNKYYEGRPATVATFGPVEFQDYDIAQLAPVMGSKVLANNATGEIAFVGSATAVPAGYTQIPASVYEILTPNGVRLWLNFPNATVTSTAAPVAAVPVATPAAGAVAAGTSVVLTSTTAGAEIRYTLDGSSPTFESPIFPVDGLAITAAVTITAVALLEGYSPSALATFAYTV